MSIILYALSTCGWCAKTETLLTGMEVDHDLIHVDLLEGQARIEAMTEVKRWNPKATFPTIVINDEKAIIGYKEQTIREAF